MNNSKAKKMYTIILVAIVAVIVISAIVTICFADENKISIFGANGDTNSSLTTFEGSNDLTLDEWEDYDFRIIYVNCESPVDNSSNYQYIKNLGDDEVISLNSPTRENTNSAKYSFVGWYLDADFTAQVTQITKKSFNTTVDGKSAVRLYAKWSTITAYEVVYYCGSGVNNANNPTSIWEDDDPFTLLDPTSPIDNGATYYDFEGWYTQSGGPTGGGTQVVALDASVEKDSQNRIALYAYYNEISYIKITLVLNGNETDNSDVTVTSTKYTIIQPDSETTYDAYARRLYGEGSFDVSDITATKAKLLDSSNNILSTYTFGGWYLTASCTGTATTTIYTENYGVTTLYAKWNETHVGYSITYVLNNGTNDARNVTYMSASSSTTLYPATRAASNYTTYTFNGWYTYYDGSSDASNGGWSDTYLISGSTASSGVSYTPSSNTTLYAKWTDTIVSFSITYHLDTSSGEANNANNPSTHTSDVILTAPTKSAVIVDDIETRRYQFAGWYDNENLTGTPVTLVKAQNIEVWPKWIEYYVYQINYHLEVNAHEEENKSNPTTYSIADGVVVLFDPVMDSYDSRIVYNFKGWHIGAQAALGNFSNDNLVTQLDENVESSANTLSTNYDPDGNGIIDLYPSWEEKPDTFIITYVLGTGEVNNPKNPTYTSTLNNARLLFAPTKITWTATASAYVANAYSFIGWFTGANGTGTQYETLYYTYGELTLYPYWGASHTTTVSKTGGAVRVDEYLKADASGDYMLYGAYYQTEVSSTSDTNFAYATIDGKYYRKEPILWRIITSSNNVYTLHSDIVLDQSVYDADATVYENSDIDTFLTGTFVTTAFNGFSDVRQEATVSGISRKVYVPLYDELGDFADVYLMKCASEYALARGVKKDTLMGTSAFWVRDIKTDAGLNGEDVPTVKFVGQRGYLSYNLVSATYIGVAPMIQVSWTSN